MRHEKYVCKMVGKCIWWQRLSLNKLFYRRFWQFFGQKSINENPRRKFIRCQADNCKLKQSFRKTFGKKYLIEKLQYINSRQRNFWTSITWCNISIVLRSNISNHMGKFFWERRLVSGVKLMKKIQYALVILWEIFMYSSHSWSLEFDWRIEIHIDIFPFSLSNKNKSLMQRLRCSRRVCSMDEIVFFGEALDHSRHWTLLQSNTQLYENAIQFLTAWKHQQETTTKTGSGVGQGRRETSSIFLVLKDESLLFRTYFFLVCKWFKHSLGRDNGDGRLRTYFAGPRMLKRVPFKSIGKPFCCLVQEED